MIFRHSLPRPTGARGRLTTAGLSRAIRAAVSLTAGACLWHGCRQAPPAPVESQWLTMNTVAALSLPAAAGDRMPAAREVVAAAFAGVEEAMSLFRPASDIARLNAADGGEAVALSGATAGVLDYALRIARESGGAFDPTVGPLMRLWGFRGGQSPPALPGANELTAALRQVGWTNIWLAPAAAEDAARTAARARAGIKLDLGGIAKGYAVDKAYDALRAAGEADFLINLAGNMRGAGRPAPARTGWRVGVRDPFAKGGYVGVVTLAPGEAVATSGNYERFVTIAGRRYSHIMDPRSGRPVAGLASVTVLATTAMEADALSTALFVLGPEAGAALLAIHPGCAAVFITDTQPPRILTTPGAAKRFSAVPSWQDSVQQP
jgi:thiamine biosynthesis lipoprotein